MSDKPGILRNLRIKRVALVDNGANLDRATGDGAHIMLFKRDTDKSMPLGSLHVDTPIGDKDKDEDEKENPVKKSFISKLLGLVTETDVEKRKLAAAALEKEFPPDDDDKPVHKADDAMCKCADCVSMRAAKLAKAEGDKSEVQKAMDAVRLEMQKSVDAANAKADQAVALAKAERESRLDGEMRDILKSFKSTPFDLTTDVARFRKMRDTDPETFDRTIALFKAQDAQLEMSSAYTNFGTRKGAGEGSAWAQLEAKADQIIEKSTTPLTREAALERVMLDPKNNKLVKQYRTEQQVQ